MLKHFILIGSFSKSSHGNEQEGWRTAFECFFLVARNTIIRGVTENDVKDPWLVCGTEDIGCCKCRCDTCDLMEYLSHVPEDCVKPKEPDTKDQEAGYDPRVLQDVVAELEAQRDTLFNFTAQAVRGEGPRVVEALRAEVEELKGEKDKITKELEATRSVAKMESLGAQQRKVQQQVQAAAQMKLGVLTHELAAVKKSHAELEAELEAVRAQQGAAPVADAEATAALQSQLRELQTKLQLCEAQRDAALAEKAAAAARLEAAAATSMSNTSTSSAEVTRLQAEIERLKASNTARAAPPAAAEAKDDTAAKIARLERLNAEQAQQLNEISAKGDQKSAACVLQ
eukprot:6181090-Pleurochrysis_carterae.AAC.7